MGFFLATIYIEIVVKSIIATVYFTSNSLNPQSPLPRLKSVNFPYSFPFNSLKDISTIPKKVSKFHASLPIFTIFHGFSHGFHQFCIISPPFSMGF